MDGNVIRTQVQPLSVVFHKICYRALTAMEGICFWSSKANGSTKAKPSAFVKLSRQRNRRLVPGEPMQKISSITAVLSLCFKGRDAPPVQ